MNLEILKSQIINGYAMVIIDRPKAMNALNSKFFDELNLLLDQYEKDESVNCIIISGEGKAFVAGADIKEMVDLNSEEAKKFSDKGQKTFTRLEQFKCPVIAAINGFALGGGCELAMACDIRIASVEAKFGQPEVNLGLIPGYGATYRLPSIVGVNNAMNLLLTGDMIDSTEALRLGLVQKIVEPENLLLECEKLATKILSKGPSAVKKIKLILRESKVLNNGEVYKLEQREFASLFGNEGREGMTAFLEKRKPNWK